MNRFLTFLTEHQTYALARIKRQMPGEYEQLKEIFGSVLERLRDELEDAAPEDVAGLQGEARITREFQAMFPFADEHYRSSAKLGEHG